MVNLRPVALLCLLLALLLLAAAPGCDSPTTLTKGKPRVAKDGDDDSARKAVKATAWGTISGKVAFEGDIPPRKPVDAGANQQACHGGAPNEDKLDEKWIVNSQNRGVQNAVVFLQPPEGSYFFLSEEQIKYKDKAKGEEWASDVVKVTQPFCAFKPHVVILFQSYYDTAIGDQKATGQRFEIVNDAGIEHNYSLASLSMSGGRTLKPSSFQEINGLKPQSKPFTIRCDIHTFMKGYGFSLDHPYAAVTDRDGTFTIPNAPLGVPLQVVAWHEAVGFFYGGEDGTGKTLNDKDALDFKIKAK